jgi:uncharacterized protein YjbI with pentapeptide repeats
MPENFHRENLRGLAFKRRDFTDANFSSADIRGTNFTDAILTGANFSHAQAGLQRRWIFVWVAVSFLLAALSGFTSAIVGVAATITLTSSHNLKELSIFSGVVLLVVLFVFCIVTIRKGFTTAFGTVAMAVAVAVPVAVVEVIVGHKATVVSVVFFMIMDVAMAGATFVLGALAVTLAKTVAVAEAMVGTIVVLVAMAGVGTRVLVAGVELSSASAILPVAVAVASLSTYIGWQALAGDEKFSWIQKIAIFLAAISGTSFRSANLTNANFTQATLKSTNLRKANLTRTCWFQAKKLDLALVETTYLENPQLRELVIKREGQEKNFDGLNLRGVNLQGANLADASFIGADLSEANLQDANLSRAQLKQTQLDRTDLTGATLTGACIEDWGITPKTKLDGVQCKYVFMRLVEKGNPDENRHRKPDNWAETFEDGDFADFIAPLVKTLLDLYHNQQVNTHAAQLSFNQLAANHPEGELSVIAVEARGKNNDKLLIRAKVAEDANTSELSAEYFSNYNRYKALPPEALRSLLAEKDQTILMFAGQVDNALKRAIERPSIYAQTYQNQGDTMSDKSSEIKIGDVSGGSISGIASNLAGENMTGVAGVVSGNVTQSIGQLENTDEPEAPKLADLLKKLQAAIEADADLSEEDKAEALDQVKALAEAGQNPKEGTMQKTAKSAIRMLKGIMADLPTVAKLVEVGQNLLPAIAQLFGL